MKRSPLNQSGLIPLLILLIIVVAIVVYLAYSRVLHAHQQISLP
ncbi:MAG TPA: hypothetical protein VG964_01045 [Candidatus Saccharimonadales bacterium]|nr:hypothetical protein [Candidatus Saccharimonadales bacterium]